MEGLAGLLLIALLAIFPLMAIWKIVFGVPKMIMYLKYIHIELQKLNEKD